MELITWMFVGQALAMLGGILFAVHELGENTSYDRIRMQVEEATEARRKPTCPDE